MKTKVYSIGRERGCDIVINDSTDSTSRRHAVLTVLPSGKMTITDLSTNGTYVNGIRISQNVAVPVTRKDNVSFAHVYRLDWSQVPKTVNPMRYAVIGLVALAVIAGAFATYILLKGHGKATDDGEGAPAPQEVQIDSCSTCQKPVADCEFQGKHPEPAPQVVDSCQTCQKPVTECQYEGKHPAPKPAPKAEKKKAPAVKKEPTPMCPTCGQPITRCFYVGSHPAKKAPERTNFE